MSETPDIVVRHAPGACSCCGHSLEDAPVIAETRRQVVDIPPVTPRYTEHRSVKKKCPGCGKANWGAYPDEVTAPIQYGPNVKRMAIYMSAYRYLPYRQLSVFFRDAFSLSVSEGTIDNILEEARRKSESEYSSIRSRASESEAVGADETGCRVNGKKRWFHVWQTKFLTFIVSHASRGYGALKENFP
jgi:transposase